MWIDSPPATCHPLDEHGAPNTAVTVEVFPFRPDLVTACHAWAGGLLLTINGGPALLLPGAVGVVGLGDYVVKAAGMPSAEPAAGFDQRYQLTGE